MKRITVLTLITLPLYGAIKDDIHHYLWANYYQFNNQPLQAQRAYQELFKKKCSAYAYKGYINLLHRMNAYPVIVSLLPQLDALFAHDTDMQLIFSQALAHTGNQTAADERIIRLNNADKSNQEIAFNATQIYIRRKELENALAVIENFLNKSPRRPNNFLFYFLQAQIYLQLRKKESAMASVKKSLDIYPYFDKGWLLRAMLEEQEGNIEQAITGYTTFLKLTKEPALEIKKHLNELLLKRKLTPEKIKDPSSHASLMALPPINGQKKLFIKNRSESTVKRWKIATA